MSSVPSSASLIPPLARQQCDLKRGGGGDVIPGLDCRFKSGLTPSDELRSTRAPSLANTDPRLLANDVHVIDDRVLEGWFPPEQEEPA